MTERERALRLLRRVEREGAYASLLLAGETGFVRTIVLGVLRWQSRLDAAIAEVSGRRIDQIEPLVLEVLRIGVYQLHYMDVPRYAAVSETVDLAGQYAARARGFVNAVMRKASQARWVEPADVATRFAHPAWLIDRWTATHGAERAAKIAAANQELSQPDVFVLYGEPPEGSTPSRYVDGLFGVEGSTGELDRERFYPMDEGSAVVAAIARATSDDILDLAAAPGGKSLFMKTRGAKVVSNDASFGRLMPLRRYSSDLTVSDGRQPPFRKQFATVLLDAPCSATGTIRKSPELKWRLRESDIATFAALQRQLLASALALAGEFVVYSTCSLEREENDDVIRAVVEGSPFAVVSVEQFAPATVAPWVDEKILRLTPDAGTDGFTVFVLRRS
jgi:16S rRNA (cytosine967-C5)-methyltransferase